MFDAIPTRIEQIRDEEEYSGLRVHVRALLYRSHIAIKLDISTGDPISPHPQLVTMPRILGGEFTLMGHPPETVIACTRERCAGLANSPDERAWQRDSGPSSSTR